VARKGGTGVLAPYGGAVGASPGTDRFGGLVARLGPSDREPASSARPSPVGPSR